MSAPFQASIIGLAAQAPQGYPPSGNYLVDSESTYTFTSGGSTLEHITRVVGSNGDTTVTQKKPAGRASTARPDTQRHRSEQLVHQALRRYWPAGCADAVHVQAARAFSRSPPLVDP